MRFGRTGALSCALLALGAASAGGQTPAALRPRTAAEDLQMFSQVLNQIRVNHPDSIPVHELYMAAIQGMIGAADPHSYVIPATRLAPEKQRALESGRLHPVPVFFDFVGGSPVVVGVAPGSAAARLDILPGDVLLAIDGAPVMAESTDELSVVLAGARGTTVRLRIERQRLDGSLVVLERDVVRERTEEAPTVPVTLLLDPQTGYIRITTFGEKTADELHAALADLDRQGMRRLVLDLRDNGGGLVGEANTVAGEFLPSGATVYVAKGRKAEVNDSVVVRRSFWRRERQFPVVVLTNEGTASAAELVTGALQDHDRALVVGRPTFGKSLLMQGFPLSDGSAVMLVVGHLQTPCGRVIQRQYRGISRRDYFHLSTAQRDTAGRPTCRSRTGRTLYGGGGIYPDVVLKETPLPVWVGRLREDAIVTRWVAAYISAHPEAVASLDAFAASARLPAGAIIELRAFATAQGREIPADPEADALLERIALPEIAGAKWGDAGFYRLVAALDPEVRAAIGEMGRASALATSAP